MIKRITIDYINKLVFGDDTDIERLVLYDKETRKGISIKKEMLYKVVYLVKKHDQEALE